MKNLKNLGKVIIKNDQKEINGGMLRPTSNCHGLGDAICCGTGRGQCACGGIGNPSNPGGCGCI